MAMAGETPTYVSGIGVLAVYLHVGNVFIELENEENNQRWLDLL